MNEYDSQKTVDILKNERNVIVTDNPDDADIILLNTCSIREKAEEKVYSDLGRLRKLKDKNPKLKILDFENQNKKIGIISFNYFEY